MTVYSSHKTGLSLADIKLKPSPPFLSLSFSRSHETYRRDRFLTCNILSLVASREETKRARGSAFGFIAAALSRRFYVSALCRARSVSLSFPVFLRISSHDSATRRILRRFNAPMPPAVPTYARSHGNLEVRMHGYMHRDDVPRRR